MYIIIKQQFYMHIPRTNSCCWFLNIWIVMSIHVHSDLPQQCVNISELNTCKQSNSYKLLHQLFVPGAVSFHISISSCIISNNNHKANIKCTNASKKTGNYERKNNVGVKCQYERTGVTLVIIWFLVLFVCIHVIVNFILTKSLTCELYAPTTLTDCINKISTRLGRRTPI